MNSPWAIPNDPRITGHILTDREAQLLEAHEAGQHEHRESDCPECSDLCRCGHWSRHHSIGRHGGCGHCDCRGFNA
jgi:hypothetical protein